MSNVPKNNGHTSKSIHSEKESLVSKQEAAKRLSISVRTLDRLAAQGFIEKIFILGSVRIKERQITEIVERGL